MPLDVGPVLVEWMKFDDLKTAATHGRLVDVKLDLTPQTAELYKLVLAPIIMHLGPSHVWFWNGPAMSRTIVLMSKGRSIILCWTQPRFEA